MNRTRAAFKLAVQYCRQHEDTIQADILANSIAFWKHVHKQHKRKAVNHAAVVGGCTGEKEIAEMYNCNCIIVHPGQSIKKLFLCMS